MKDTADRYESEDYLYRMLMDLSDILGIEFKSIRNADLARQVVERVRDLVSDSPE